MAGIIPFAFVLKFSYISHILLLIAAIVPAVILYVKNKDTAKSVLSSRKSVVQYLLNSEETIVSNKIFLFLILPITLVICVLMFNHILMPYSGGAVSSGQSTYGDLQMHLGFVTSIAEQKDFPPEYCFLSGTRLNYPFFD
jgi:hypothetical protein